MAAHSTPVTFNPSCRLANPIPFAPINPTTIFLLADLFCIDAKDKRDEGAAAIRPAPVTIFEVSFNNSRRVVDMMIYYLSFMMITVKLFYSFLSSWIRK